MGRPAEVTDEEIIRAGNALVADNRAVNGTRLLKGVGGRGRTSRMMEVWTRHVEASTTVSQEPSSAVAALPEAASRLLSDCKGRLNSGLDACVHEIYAVVERAVAGRFQTEMAAMTTSRESYQAELHEAWQAMEELAEKHDAAMLQAQDWERGVLVAQTLLESERGVLSRVEMDKVALSARIHGLTAELADASALARAAETGRTRAETLVETTQAELLATRAELDGMRTANLALDREVSAVRRACQLQETQLQRQAEACRDLHTELADARERQLEEATRATGAEQALQALERVMARNARDRIANSAPPRGNRRVRPTSQSTATGPSKGPEGVDEELTPGLERGAGRHGRSLPQSPNLIPSTPQQGPP